MLGRLVIPALRRFARLTGVTRSVSEDTPKRFLATIQSVSARQNQELLLHRPRSRRIQAVDNAGNGDAPAEFDRES